MALNIQLKKIRKDKGKTQADIADLLGVTQGAVGNWERGDFKPSIENLIALTELLECTINQLLGIEPYKNLAERLAEKGDGDGET